ncbi:MAG: DUF5110 domain-containing protein [Bacteroidales bacterium]|nr:DUF5110 domain-containing protein [Bacteroidales bacterium]
MKLKLFFISLAVLLSANVFAQDDPVANPDAVVVCGKARFTVLTSKLVRMEWAEDGKFEDNASLAIINRNLPVPAFKKSVSKNGVTIRTADLTLRYKGPGKFTAENLSVEFTMKDARAKKGVKKVKWTLASDDSANLMGTVRTLDGCESREVFNGKNDPYDKGILSRDGWALVDESDRHIMVKDDSDWGSWVAARPEGDRQDLYLFAYGHEYKEALADFTKVAGRIPLPPKYVFGYWWSRYWQYSDFEFIDLAKEIRSHNIPMDVMVIDMDWHDIWTLSRNNPPGDEFGERIGWTGYTWQKQLFPNPEFTLKQLHNMNMKTSLNLHPASGIQPYEDCYDGFVKDYLSRAKEYDGPKDYRYNEGDSLLYLRSRPKHRIRNRVATAGEKAPVPFRICQQEWADAYFNSVIRPLEKQGVDFWWLDWQQYKTSEYLPNLSNTFWLNHTFFNDKVRQSKSLGLSATRPLIYHRWGGLGSHRYQIGFSGDAYDTWEVLKFLPYFTSTSSNVGYGYWGHDIGGHQVQKGTDPYKPEIYTRWLQYGVFTPIFKTHSTKSSTIERRIWAYAPEYFAPMRDAIRLRYTLSHYIYDAARQTYDTGVSMCRPMYYDWPEKDEAYTLDEQFMFGDNIMATVICSPVNAATGLAERYMWFPEGFDWYDMTTGQLYKGGQKLTLSYTINENPWFVKAGSIIPLADENIESLQEKNNTLRLFVAPGDGESSYVYYEDDGMSQAYTNDYATTLIKKQSNASSCRVEVAAREGKYAGMDANRRVQIILEGVFVPSSVTVNGEAIAYERFAEEVAGKASWNYSGKDLAVVVTLPEAAADQAVVVECNYTTTEDVALLRGKKGIFNRMMKYTPVLKDKFNEHIDRYKLISRPFLKVAQCASLIENNLDQMVDYLKNIDVAAVEADLMQEIEAIKSRNSKNAEKHIQAVYDVIECIKQQCNL